MVFKPPRTAIIGAGLSGLVSAKHLQSSGISVVVYERSSRAGGNWVYDPRKAPEPPYPSMNPSQADTSAQLDPSREELQHAPPGPAYEGLTTNVPTYLQELKGYPWPEGQDAFVNVRVCGEYLQGYARRFGVESIIKYNTKVDKIEKKGEKWVVESRSLDGGYESEEFNNVVVASGHYHACKVPDIRGLKEWKKEWPERVQHSKSYRRPDEFQDQNILLIGAGVSSTDIARELSYIAKSIYQSSRGSPYDLPVELLPANATRIAEVSSFDDLGTVTLKDGTRLENIDRVIICTGYHFSLPFLKEFHNDSLPLDRADDKVLVTNGTQMHNLHRDIFYIPDPTLAFIGVPFYTATFSFFEYQAIALAAVFSGRAWLPGEEEMRKEYAQRVERKGLGRAFHDMKGEEVEYVKVLVDWINEQAEVTGGGKVEGHSREWMEGKAVHRETFLKFLAEKEKREREKVLLRSTKEVHQI